VYRNQGYNGQRISTHAVEWQIQQYAVLNDAIGYSYQQDGHSFYVLMFPTAQATWVFDVATGLWHERAYWDGVQYRRHRSNCQANFAGQVLVGDWENGRVYAFDPEVYDDSGATQRWLRSWRALPTGQNSLKRTAHHTLQLDVEAGSVSKPTDVELIPNPGGPFSSPVGWTAGPNTSISINGKNLQITALSSTAPYAYASFESGVGELVSISFRMQRQGSAATVFRFGTSPNSAGLYSFANSASDTGVITNSFVSLGGTIYATFGQPTSVGSSDLVFGSATAVRVPNIDPQVMLRWSDDGGHTWSNEHWASMGKIGEYGKRVIWRRLGMTTKLRDRVYEISGTDPVKIAIMGAELSATPTSA
jgi:hypothetical protein